MYAVLFLTLFVFKKSSFTFIDMNSIRITTTQNIELEYDLASLGERIAGYIIDYAIIVAYVLIVLLLFSLLHINSGWFMILFFIPVFFYDLASEVLLNGQTVGKKILKIKVISINGNQASLGQYLIRWLLRMVDFSISFDLCALVCVAVSENKQRVGDIVAGTAVIKTKPRTVFEQTIFMPVVDLNYQVTFPDVVNLSDKDMQTVKEVTLQVLRTRNNYLAYHAAEKVRSLLRVETQLEPAQFLQVIIADYNYLTSRT